MKKVSCVVLLFLFFLILYGCADKKTDESAHGRASTQTPMTSLEYAIYMNKQVTVFINQISSRMGVCRSIVSGADVDNEVEMAKESIEVMQDIYDEVSMVYPPDGADDDWEMALLGMETAIGHMQGYVTTMEAGNDVSGYIEDFENDFNQMTGIANLYYE